MIRVATVTYPSFMGMCSKSADIVLVSRPVTTEIIHGSDRAKPCIRLCLKGTLAAPLTPRHGLSASKTRYVLQRAIALTILGLHYSTTGSAFRPKMSFILCCVDCQSPL